jgi:hypothetical protein
MLKVPSGEVIKQVADTVIHDVVEHQRGLACAAFSET